LSCPDVPPLRFRGTLVSIRWRTVVMCSERRQIAAVPPQVSTASSRHSISTTGYTKKWGSLKWTVSLTLSEDYRADFSASTFLCRLLDPLYGDRIPSGGLAQSEIAVG
jgi:hypothetical protein